MFRQMSTVWAVLAILISTAAFPPSVHGQGLSAEVRADLAIVALERALLASDYAEVLEQIDRLREIKPDIGDSELLYFEALAAKEVGDLGRAETALSRFLTNVGQQSNSYNDALALMLDLEPLQEAREAELAEQARQAEADRIAEQQRRQEQAAASAQDRLRASEAALNLTAAEIRHIRWILYRHAGEVGMPVQLQELGDAERDYLQEQYLPDVGLPPARYLTAVHARHFRSQVFVPVQPGEPSSAVRTVTSGDWTVIEDQKYCWIETPATEFTQGAVYRHPVFEMVVAKPQYEMAFDTNIVLPHPFDESRNLTATIDGRRFPLSFVNGRIWPFAPGASPTNNAVHKAVRAAESITINGTSRATGQAMTVSFSAIGFTRAFYLMTEYCNREDLNVWIE